MKKSDFWEIRKLFQEEFKDAFENAHKILRDDIATFKDQIVGEIKTLREEVAVTTGYRDKIENHETRIEKLEQAFKTS